MNTYGMRFPGSHSIIVGPFKRSSSSSKSKKRYKRRKRNGTKQRTVTQPKPRELTARQRMIRDSGPIFSGLKVGTRIEHITLGKGTVKKLEEDRALVLFDGAKRSQPLKRSTLDKNAWIVASAENVRPGSQQRVLPELKSENSLADEAEESSNREKEFLDIAPKLIGAQVAVKSGDVGYIESISDGKVTVYLRGNGNRRVYSYPQGIMSGSVKILRRIYPDLAQRRQSSLFNAVNRFIG